MNWLGDYHVHTTFCDGRDTPEAMARAAAEQAEGYDPRKLPIYDIDDFEEAIKKAQTLAQPGDVVIIMTYALVTPEEARDLKPRVIFPDTRTNLLPKA